MREGGREERKEKEEEQEHTYSVHVHVTVLVHGTQWNLSIADIIGT